MKTKMMAIFCGSLRSGWMVVSVAIIFLCSCSVIKNTHKTSTTTSIDKDSTAMVKNQTEKRTDATIKTVVTEKVDTSITVPGQVINGEFRIGEAETITTDQGAVVDISAGREGKQTVHVTLPAKTVPIKIDKRTESTADINEIVKSSTDARAEVKESRQANTKALDKSVSRKTFFPWWLWVILALGVAYGVYRIYRKFAPF